MDQYSDPNDRKLDTVTELNVNEYVFNAEDFDSTLYVIAIHFKPVFQYQSILKVESFYWNWVSVHTESE